MLIMIAKALKVLSWNANGNCNRISDRLALYTRICELEIDIVSINEAHANNVFLPGFQTVSVSADLVVLVRIGISFTILKNYASTSADILILNCNKVLIICSYLRNGKSSEGLSTLIENILFFQTTFPSIVVIGDLNAKLSQLGNRSSNTAGNLLQNFLDSMETFIVLNEPEVFTFQRNSPYNRNQVVRSVLDLCLITEKCINLISRFEVLDSFGSDHFPLYLELFGKFDLDPFLYDEYESFYELRSKNLHLLKHFPDSFRKDVSENLNTFLENEASCSPEEHWEKIQQSIYEALKKNSMLKSKKKNNYHSMKLSRELLDLKKTNRNLFRKKIAILRQEQWHTFVSSIDSDEDRSSIWRKFKISRGKKRVSYTKGDLHNEVESIRLSFETNSQPSFPVTNLNLDFLKADVDSSPLNFALSLQEVKLGIQNLKNSSPGPDGISANILKELDAVCVSSVTVLLNKLFGSSNLPKNMKHCLQIALPKTTPGDFRPVTLMNCILKLLEWIILQRITPHISPLLPKEQFGFRKKMSSADQASHLIMRIQSAREKKKCCGVVFLDIKKAFDRIDRALLLDDLFKCGIQGKVLRTLSGLLDNNVYRVIYESFLSSEYSTNYGTPQGSLLSPILWNFYFRNIAAQRTVCDLFGFADDVAVFCEAYNYQDLFGGLTNDMNSINLWCVNQKIELSLTKTKFVDFSPNHRKKRKRSQHEILLHNIVTGESSVIEQVSFYRYLGVIIDENLNFKSWMAFIVQEMQARITLVLRLSRSMKLKRRNIEIFYNGYVRGFMKYGSQIWSTFPYSVIQRLEIVDRKGIRMCCGALPRTSNVSLELESNLPSFSFITLKSQVKQGVRTLFHIEHDFLKNVVLENFEFSNLASQWISIWQEFELPRAPNIEKANLLVRTKFQFKRVLWKYREGFWEERTLSRLRMGIIPSRFWAFSVKLSDSPLCRHCESFNESNDHLFYNCSALDYTSLREFYSYLNVLNLPFNFDSISLLLRDSRFNRSAVENCLLQFIRNNSLFKF
jgi:hypothetical protein